MRFLKVTTFYEDYLRQFYWRHPLLAFLPFAQQIERLFADCYGWCDFYQHALEPLGYDAHELVINAEPAQRAWALEHGIDFPSREWALEVAFAQVKRNQPEILFLDDTSTFPLAWIERVRASCPSLRLVIGWSGAPSTHQNALSAYDAILSCIPEIVARLSETGKRTFHVHHAFEPTILQKIDTKRPATIGLSFVGQMVPGSALHEERQRMLVRLAELFDIEIHSPGVSSLKARARRRLDAAVTSAGDILAGMPLPERVRAVISQRTRALADQYPKAPESFLRQIRSPVFGLEMFQLLRDSRATFNCHLGASRRSASNMRLFEATGVGTCLVTDSKDNLAELFTPDEEVVTYRSLEECTEKLNWVLTDSARARAIGAKAQARVLRDHTYAVRAARLDELIRGLLA